MIGVPLRFRIASGPPEPENQSHESSHAAPAGSGGVVPRTAGELLKAAFVRPDDNRLRSSSTLAEDDLG